VVSWC